MTSRYYIIDNGHDYSAHVVSFVEADLSLEDVRAIVAAHEPNGFVVGVFDCAPSFWEGEWCSITSVWSWLWLPGEPGHIIERRRQALAAMPVELRERWLEAVGLKVQGAQNEPGH